MKIEPIKDVSLVTVPNTEIRLKARSVSRGVAVGRVICLHGGNRQFYRIDLKETAVSAELRRLSNAIKVAKRQLEKIICGKGKTLTDSGSDIFAFHSMILDDPSFRERIAGEISGQKVNAEWAVKLASDTYVSKYKSIPDEHFRNRYVDLEDICDRVLTALGGGRRSKLKLAKNAIIVAKELRPSTLYELANNAPAAIITENGGWTSHTFILAREMGIPAVAGLKKILRRVEVGDTVIVDGFNGQVILNPESKTSRQYFAAAKEFRTIHLPETEIASGPRKTLDGRDITILANSEIPSTYKKAKRLGVQGVGLYRSEFLFNRFKGFPTEHEQIAAYRNMAEQTGRDGLKIRTFDIGVEQLIYQNENKEKNPALGLRAVRLGLTYKDQTKIQLRSILQASFQNNIDILIPMISGLSEVQEMKSILKRERELLLKKGKPVGDPRIGVMIEIPSAVLMAKELAEETDFICLGTNDLVQYLLAADRDNEAVSNWFRTLHPAVIRAIRMVIEAGEAAGKPVIVCGEMAGSPFYAPILIGLGTKNLSMNVSSIPVVGKVISGIAFEEAVELVRKIEKQMTAAKIEDIVHLHITENWAHLFPPDFLKQR